MSDAVLYDAWCGEPIAWCRVGEPVIGHEWTGKGQVAVTDRLTPPTAVEKYGAVTQIRVGLQGGFQTVTYGTTKFTCKFLDPRGAIPYDESVVSVNDPIKDDHECPVCDAVPGAPCLDEKAQPRNSHRKRRDGRTHREIETAQAEQRAALEKAEASERWQREMATPPAAGTVVEVKRQKWIGDPEWRWVPDSADSFTVEHTYANWTVRGIASDGTPTYLARNEQSGDWHAICGEPTSARFPCRTSLPCRTKHKAGLTLHQDRPWT